MWGQLNFVHDASKGTASNWITVKQNLQSQTKACITISCEICTLLRYYTAWNGNSAPFWDNLSICFLTLEAGKLRGSRNPKERTQHGSS